MSKAFIVAYLAAGASTAFDLATTHHVIRQGGRELNPVLAPISKNRVAMASVVGGVSMLTVNRALTADGKTRWAIVGMVVGVHVAAGVHNMRQYR